MDHNLSKLLQSILFLLLLVLSTPLLLLFALISYLVEKSKTGKSDDKDNS